MKQLALSGRHVPADKRLRAGLLQEDPPLQHSQASSLTPPLCVPTPPPMPPSLLWPGATRRGGAGAARLRGQWGVGDVPGIRGPAAGHPHRPAAPAQGGKCAAERLGASRVALAAAGGGTTVVAPVPLQRRLRLWRTAVPPFASSFNTTRRGPTRRWRGRSGSGSRICGGGAPSCASCTCMAQLWRCTRGTHPSSSTRWDWVQGKQVVGLLFNMQCKLLSLK